MSNDILPSDTQNAAIQAIKAWYKALEFDDDDKLLPEQKQIFRVFGYAGSGKTTITKLAIHELDLALDGFEVRFAAFTGKAALVMRRSGTPAQTVHSLIYSVREATEQEIDEAKAKLEKMQIEALALAGLERTLADAQTQALAAEIKKMKLPQFGLNTESDLTMAKLLVLDECSMIGPEMASDILSFRKPVLVLGDPGQLPPIRGEGFFTESKPDVFLTKIHRQAAESPIIRLATAARLGHAIEYGQHGDDGNVWKLHKNAATPEMLIGGGDGSQVLCGLNVTRFELNNAMRRALGIDHTSPMPIDGDKIICLKNRNDIGLINGCFLELSGIEPFSPPRFHAIVKTEDGEYPAGEYSSGKKKKLTIYTGHFEDHISLDKERADRDWKAKKGLVEATYGYAITTHKAQGSGWENIIYWDDHFGRTQEDYARHLYTGITRAVSGLLILD